MKRIISLLLALAMSLALCACGNEKTESESTPMPSSEASITAPVIIPETVSDKIDLGNLVLAEDDKVKISLVEFYTNPIISAGNSDGAKCATFKIENKTDREMNVWVIPYLHNEGLEAVFIDGNSTAVEAGRIGRMGFSFTYGAYPNWTDVESLDELYELEFTFELSLGAGTSNFESYEVKCSVDAALNPESNDATALNRFSFRNDVHFGDSMDEITAKEQVLEIDYESAGEDGYVSAQAKSGMYETVTFEGAEDAYLFYFFDAKTMDLSQVYVMFGHGDDYSSMKNTYEDFLKLYFERYGVHLSKEQMEYVPIDTIAYEYATSYYEDTQLEKHTRWLLEDAEGYVILDVATSLIFGDSYYTFVGLRHVTQEEIVAAGGNLSAIFPE